MGIEPTRAPPPELENTGFRLVRPLKCDGSVNFRGMWGNVGMRLSLFGRACASRASCRAPRPPYAAAWRSTSQPLHASRTVRGTSCSPLA
jgi:hypothetical protein